MRVSYQYVLLHGAIGFGDAFNTLAKTDGMQFSHDHQSGGEEFISNYPTF